MRPSIRNRVLYKDRSSGDNSFSRLIIGFRKKATFFYFYLMQLSNVEATIFKKIKSLKNILKNLFSKVAKIVGLFIHWNYKR